MEKRICALPGCENEVTNWRSVCCCRAHQRKFGGLRSRNLVEKVEPVKLENIRRGKGKSPPKLYKDKTSKEKALWSAYVVARRKKRDKSMPKWANKVAIEEFYIKARLLTEETGIRHEVDHIIPLNHALVCGLHVEHNLQVITKTENQKKSNNFDVS